MKKIYISLLCAALTGTMSFAQDVATFEDLGLSADAYWDGSDGSAVFTSGDYSFINNFVDWGGYTSWDGFAYSTMTSTAYAALSDQYNSCVGHGFDNSHTYAVAYYSPYNGTTPTVINKDALSFEAKGFYVTNSAYAYTSMSNGDAYAKKFDETDWFLLTITGYLNNEKGNTVEFYLAKDGNIVSDWQYLDLSVLGTVDQLQFTLSSSDTGEWGMNTPAYFCMDNFGAESPITSLRSVNVRATNHQTYDLQGRLSNVAKGFVIKDGRVTFVK